MIKYQNTDDSIVKITVLMDKKIETPSNQVQIDHRQTILFMKLNKNRQNQYDALLRRKSVNRSSISDNITFLIFERSILNENA